MATVKTTRRWFVASAIMVGVVVIGPCGFGSSRVCRTCGLVQYQYERQLPLMDVTYWTTQSTQETKLSRMLREKDLVAEHEHDWVFRSGSGNGVACAIGPARNWHCDTAEIVSFLADVAKYDGADAAHYVKSRLLDKNETDPLMQSVLSVEYPENGVANKTEYVKKIAAIQRTLEWRDSSLNLPLKAKPNTL